MNRNSLIYTLGRKVKSRTSIVYILGLIEQIYLRNNVGSEKPQLFILGLPRSGTTIIYQYLVHRLELAYFTNGVGKYYLSPCIVTSWQQKLYGPYHSDFRSKYGKVLGPTAPREAGSFWGRFFGLDEYISFRSLTQQDIHTLQTTISCIQNIYNDAPFINKNVKHMLRLDALRNVFMNSQFLIVERELKDIALSILRARYINLEDPSDWWSVKPPNYLELKDLSIIEQVVYQVTSLEKKLEYDLSKIPSTRIFRVNYKEFCQNPEILIEKVNSVIGGVGYRNKPKSEFSYITNDPQNSEEIELVKFLANVI